MSTTYPIQDPQAAALDYERLVNRQVIAFARNIVQDPDAKLIMCTQSVDPEGPVQFDGTRSPKPPVWGPSEIQLAHDIAWGLTQIGYHRQVQVRLVEDEWQLSLDSYPVSQALFMLPENSCKPEPVGANNTREIWLLQMRESLRTTLEEVDKKLALYHLIRRSTGLIGYVLIEGSALKLAHFEHHNQPLIPVKRDGLSLIQSVQSARPSNEEGVDVPNRNE